MIGGIAGALVEVMMFFLAADTAGYDTQTEFQNYYQSTDVEVPRLQDEIERLQGHVEDLQRKKRQ